MIYHASMRTDIPAFYSKWFYNRIRAGWFAVRNPYNDQSVTKHSLDPAVTDLLMFCTKNPEPMLSGLDLLRDYHQSWHVTITPYGSDLEPNVPPKNDVVSAVQYLASIIGADRIAWRYDPIILTERYPIDYHVRAFERLASRLQHSVSSVIISFVLRYPKLRVLAPFLSEVSASDKRIMIGRLSEISKRYSIPLKLCAEPHIYTDLADQSGCETESGLESKIGYPIRLPRTKPKRTHCNCYLGLDMGAYNSCPHLCRYCYANNQTHEVTSAFNGHDPLSPILIGDVPAGVGLDISPTKDRSYKADGVLF